MNRKVSERVAFNRGGLVRGSLPWKYEQKGFRKSGLKEGLSGQGVHYHGNMNRKVSERVALKRGGLVRGPLQWNYEQKSFRNRGHKRGVVFFRSSPRATKYHTNLVTWHLMD